MGYHRQVMRDASLLSTAARRGMMLALLLTGAACRTTAPSNDVPYSQVDLVVGTGAVAAVGQTLNVDYTGYMYDSSKADGRGPVFDTSIGKVPFNFVLAKGNVIDGWVQGIPGMQEGGTRRLVIPPSLAYGNGSVPGSLPPNATLIFDITLISIQQ
jgi:FKBP-type peptidyl-prolyl cis-trans isomerase FkpA